ncbi:MAG: winged helix-turn-helix transcriptional regulator [Campylobacterales bacterium]|nr:winged helix-turn-helix transcriptional regulator [Campylobacterales bacterium]
MIDLIRVNPKITITTLSSELGISRDTVNEHP